METKAITIKDVTLVNIEKFNANRKGLQLTPAGYFDKILNNSKTEVNPVNTDGLQVKIDELTEVNQALQTVNQKVNEENQALLNEKTELKNNFDFLTKNPPAVELQNLLTGTQFILTPNKELATKMSRSIAYDRKEGKLKEVEVKDYLQHFTERAIKYFLKNEYSHI